VGILSSIVGGLILAVFGEMVSQEVRDRLDHLPHAILRLAARWLDPAQRAAIYDDEWMPELAYILKGDEARPVTRLTTAPASRSASYAVPTGSPLGLTDRLPIQASRQPGPSST
jgi:hypothetical protein